MNAFSRVVLIAFLCGGAILGIGVLQSQKTAEAAVLKQDPAAAQFKFQGDYIAPFGLGRFLLYQWPAPTATAPVYGYIPVKRNFWGQWRVGTGGPCSSTSTATRATSALDLVDFHAHYVGRIYGNDKPADYSVICGRVASAEVHTVSVRWEDGAITEGLVKQGWFIILKPGRQAACQLQLLATTETVIQTIDLAQFDFPSTATTEPLPRCGS